MTITVSIINSQLPLMAWHSVISLGSGLARTYGGQIYDGSGNYQANSYRVNLSSGVADAVWTTPYNHAHCCAINLDGRHTIAGGMGKSGSPLAFTPWSVVQWKNASDASEGWVSNALAPWPGYDLEAVALTSTRMMVAGGHTWVAAINNTIARMSAAVMDKTSTSVTTTPLFMQTPRSYSNGVRLSDTNAIFIGGCEYLDSIAALRNIGTIEELGNDGYSSIWPNPIRPRRYQSARTYDGITMVYGGTDQPYGGGRPAACGYVDKIDLSTKCVTTMDGLSYPRYHAATATVIMDSCAYDVLIGGQSDNHAPVTDIELYNRSTGESSVIGTSAPTVDHDRITIAEGNTVTVICGENASTGQGTSTLTRIVFPSGTTCMRT